ncbi:hypothetical protein RIF29_00027 [Crotalaria pallida]|uniref:Uncharacterized protein n=1 Tax=Crotalaria pallida TaxID=3830 RepID=A0AAN9P6E7_CROPI
MVTRSLGGLTYVLMFGVLFVWWAMALLFNYPETMNKVQIEIGTHIEQDQLLHESDAIKLKHLQNVITEMLRLSGKNLFGSPSLQLCRAHLHVLPSSSSCIVLVRPFCRKMCEDSSSNIVGNPPSETELGDGVNEVEDDIECEEDVALNGDDQYQIDGMDDIGSVRFDLLNVEELSKYHFVDNSVGYNFY